MPTYEFMCSTCLNSHVLELPITEYEKVRDSLKSTCCNSQLQRVYITTGILDNCRGFYGRNKS